MSADDFRDLIEEFDHSGVTTLRFFRVTEGAVRNGIPGTPTLTEFSLTGAYAYVPKPPQSFFDQQFPDKRERADGLVWMEAEDDDGNATNVLQTVDLVGHSTADRAYDEDQGKWYVVRETWRYRRQAKVAGAVLRLIDEDLGAPP